VSGRDWQPIATMPWQTVCEVRNPQMEEPCRATRGYTHNGMVHPDTTFCTSVFTPHRFFPTPSGRLVCPTEWRPLDCANHPGEQSITYLDGDPLCQTCADAWVRAEGAVA
jgi:hypothetical protein